MYESDRPFQSGVETAILPPGATPATGGSDPKSAVLLHNIVPARPSNVAETGLELESLEEPALKLIGPALAAAVHAARGAGDDAVPD